MRILWSSLVKEGRRQGGPVARLFALGKDSVEQTSGQCRPWEGAGQSHER
ncbi:MAG: hypothetical protein IJA79_09785 [Desulfovibrio sp.]|nr:hypothetical protein [Desulfovibrio sp.]